ncbi:MAG: DNA polymerase IV [Deltaproteobacteria bacterium]|nr:DNA polymerase IV [Deltaproteobacteria bacterium]
MGISNETQRPRAIVHVDMDAFFAAVEVLDDPSLAGLPLVVGGGEARGVVCSASYEARAFGVKSAQPVATARRLCPGAVFLPVRHRRYAEVSRQVFAILAEFSPLVEPVSVDEAFLDLTGCERLFGPAAKAAAQIRRRIAEEVGITASAGIAINKLCAKVASDLCKPNGLLEVPPGTEAEFLAPLPLSRLWGAGPAAQKELAKLGITTIGALARADAAWVEKRFGKWGASMHAHARGIDPRPVRPPAAARSVGKEETFDADLYELARAHNKLLSLCGRVARRLRKKQARGKTVTLKVKYADFVQITRSATLEHPTDDAGEIYRACRALLARTQVGSRPVRLLGVTVSSLHAPGMAEQKGLFDQGLSQRASRLNAAIDAIADRWGDHSILPAALVDEED